MKQTVSDIDLYDIKENTSDVNIEIQTQDEIKEFAGVLKQYVRYNPSSYITKIIDECEIVREGSMVYFCSNVLNLLEEKVDMICAGIDNPQIIIRKQHKCETYQVSCKDFIGHFIWGEFGNDVVQKNKQTNKDFFKSMKTMAKIIYDAKQKIKNKYLANTDSNEIITSKTDFDTNNSIEFLNELKETTAKKINDIAVRYDLKNQNPFFKLIHEFNQVNSDNVDSIKKILFVEIGCFFLDITLLRPIYQFCKFCFNGKQKLNTGEDKFNLCEEKNNSVAKIVFFILEVLCVSILIFNIGLIFNILSGVFLLLIIFAMIYQRKKQYPMKIKKYLFNKLCLCVEPIITNHDFLKDRANILLKTFNTEIDTYIKKFERMKEKPKGFEEIHCNDNLVMSKDID